ncbi:hypothetical protein Goshw_022172 [Gossypium schwendimanii]|uniref:Uncharacterized protein n=1 Tax=Gossypium schwendimanii TaxID=34291 RepID=A0A7J9MV25_GOSSC|nr:hypothetical protein [Gossypium schwendimanii]
MKKTMNQCYYTGDEAMSKDGGSSTEVPRKDQHKEKEQVWRRHLFFWKRIIYGRFLGIP